MPLPRRNTFVLAAALLAACGYVVAHQLRSYAEGAGAWSRDGTRGGVAAADVQRRVAWDEPRELELGGATLTADARAALSPDGRWLVFPSGMRGADVELYVCEVRANGLSAPRRIAAVSSAADELAPSFGVETLWFASDRAGGAGGLDLWRAPLADGEFGVPEHAGGACASAADDTDPAEAPDGSAFVFASDRAGAFDLYTVSEGSARDARAVESCAEFTGPLAEREPAFADDGRALVFARQRAVDAPFELVRSARVRDRWCSPAPLAGFADARGAAFSADGLVCAFVRAGETEEHATERLWLARARVLHELPPRPWTWVDTLTVASLVALALLAWLAPRSRALDLLYKCLLVSVALHLLLLALLQYFFVGGDGAARPEPARHRVRFVPDVQASAARERAGSVGTAQRADTAAPERAVVEPAVEASASAPSAPLELARARVEPTAPARGAIDAPGVEESPRDVRVAAPVEIAVRRGTERAELALVPATQAQARATSSPAEPRTAAGAPLPELAQPAGRALAFVPTRVSSADAPAPSRAAADSRAPADAPALVRGVELAQPADDKRAAHAASPARALALESAEVGGAGVAAREPARVSIATPDAEAELGAPRPGPVATSATVKESPGAPVRASGAVDAPAASAAAGEVALRDRERTFAPAEPSAPVPLALEATSARVAPAEAQAPVPHAFERDVAPDPRPEPARDTPLARVPAAETDLAPRARKPWDHTPYANRAGEEKARALALHGGDAQTEAAVARGLAYLARVQRRAGHWGPLDARDDKYGQIAVGKTGLALLAFLGAGHTPNSATEHSRVVERAVAALVALQDPATGHFGDSDAYGHGIATYALAECLALTGDAALRPVLARAVDQIVANQDTHADPRLFGGWSYFFRDGHVYDRWPRTSITAWQVMALESSRLSGLDVPDAVFDGARAFLEHARDDDAGWWRYNFDTSRHYATLPASTPAGMFAMSLLGADLASDEYAPLRRFVLERRPRDYRFAGDDAFVERGTGNVYFWYYGTLAMFRAGGASWRTWNEGMKQALVPAQSADGAWEPIDPYAKYARDGANDKSFTTALCVLSLEVYYRYYLPLLRVK